MHIDAYTLVVVEWQEWWSPRAIHRKKLSKGFCQNFGSIRVVFWLGKPKTPAKKRAKKPLILLDPLEKGCSITDSALLLTPSVRVQENCGQCINDLSKYANLELPTITHATLEATRGFSR